MIYRKIIYTLLCFLIIPSFTFAQVVLQGVITDAETKQPLIGANVVIKELNRGISTNSQGQFQFENIRPGTYTLRVTFVGYHDEKLKIDLTEDQKQVVIQMNIFKLKLPLAIG